MYKMGSISAEGYNNAHVGFLTIKTTSEIWVNMKDVGSGMRVKNISDLDLIWYLWDKKSYKKNKLMNIRWQKDKFIKSLLI